MAETKNIFLKRQVAADNIDSYVKTGKAAIALRNGDIVDIGAKQNGVYTLTAPTAGTTMFGIVYNADVVTEGNYRGLSDDPRDVEFKPGTIVNFFIPKKGDEIAITVASGTESGATHLVPEVDKTGYAYATEAGAKLAFKIEDTGFVSVGNERVKTVKAFCVAE